MKNRNNPNKINQIIEISKGYLSHRKNLTKVRGLVDHSSDSRNRDISDFLKRQKQYRAVIKGRQKQILNRENVKVVNRIESVSRENSSRSRTSLSNSRAMQKTLSQQSLLCSKTRKNFLKDQQIHRQNQKMYKRIINSRSKDRLGPSNYIKSQKQTKQLREVVGRYSDRNRKQMLSMLDFLHLDAKKVPFLPYVKPQKTTARHKSHFFERI